MPALRAHAQMARQLLVAIVGAAAGTGVRVLLRTVTLRRRLLVLDRDVDLVGGGHCAILDPLGSDGVTGPARRRIATSVETSASGRKPVRPKPATGERAATARSSASTSRDRRPARLGHEAGDLAGPQHVAVQRDVDAIASVQRPVDVLVDPRLREIGLLRRIEAAGTDERDVLRTHRSLVDRHPQRHPPEVPRRRALGRVEVAVRVQPDDSEPAAPRCEPADRSDVRAAAAAEHERALGEVRRLRFDLLRERLAARSPWLPGTAAAASPPSAIASPPAPQARGTRTSPAANSRPQLWHW